MRLWARIALGFLLLVGPLGALFVLGGLEAARRYHQEIVQSQYRDLAKNLLDMAPDLSPKGGGLDALAHELAMANPGVEVYLLDPGGRVVGASVPMDAIRRKEIPLGPLRTFARGQGPRPLLGADPKRTGGRQAFSAARLPDGGWLYVLLSDRRLDSVAAAVEQSTVLRLALSLAGGLLLLAALLAAAIAFFLTRRTDALARAMAAFDPESGPLPPAPKRIRDEVDALAARFAELARRVRGLLASERAADRHRRELLAGVSHDLRTPLAVLAGTLEALQSARLSPEEQARYLAAAENQVARLSRMIDALFTLARLEAGAWPFAPEPLRLDELAQDVVLEWRPRLAAKGLALAFDPAPHPVVVRGEPGLLERVLLNLLENALAHTPAGSWVRVEVGEGKKGAFLAVADGGEGIPPEVQGRIFEPRFGQRTGLGLAIAAAVARLHGGGLEVESAPGKGSRFLLWLPENP